MSLSAKGRKGEDQAAVFLTAAGYTILIRNYRCRTGEIDIIAEKEEILVFAEVKTWDIYQLSDIEYAVNRNKMNRIVKAAEYFLMENRSYGNRILRFDVIFITENLTVIKHIKNAFYEV